MAVGRFRLRVEPYDPDAVDADGDGIVQEGTAWERPGGTRIVDTLLNEIRRGLTSTNRSSQFRVVDRNGNSVRYTPTYMRGTGAQAVPDAPSRPTSKLGPSLRERGLTPIGQNRTLKDRFDQSEARAAALRASSLQRAERENRLLAVATATNNLSSRRRTYGMDIMTPDEALHQAQIDAQVQQFLSQENLSPVDRGVVEALTLGGAYWATYLFGGGDLGSLVNDIATGVGDAGTLEQISVLRDMLVIGGVTGLTAALTAASEKWGTSKERINQFVENFSERMRAAGERFEDMRQDLADKVRDILTQIGALLRQGPNKNSRNDTADEIQVAIARADNLVDAVVAAAPEPNRPGEYMKVSVNPTEHDTNLNNRVTAMVERYLPEEKRNLPAREQIDDLMKAMGVPQRKSFDVELDEAMQILDGQVRQNLVSFKTDLTEADDAEKVRLENMISPIEWALELMEDPDGREILKEKMAKNYLKIIESFNQTFDEYPELRGNVLLALYEPGKSHHPKAGGYAGADITDDGLISGYVQINPQSLVIGVLGDADGPTAGQILQSVVRVDGADSYHNLLGIHELAHQIHYASALSRYGIKYSDTETIIDQMQKTGPTLGSHTLAMQWAINEGISPNTPFSELTPEQRRSLQEYTRRVFRRFQDPSRGRGEEWKTDITQLAAFSGLPGAGQQKVFRGMLESIRDNKPIKAELDVPDEFRTPEGIQNYVREMTGSTLSELVQEIYDAQSADMGIDIRNSALGGIDRDLLEQTLADVSKYGRTNPMEAIAEAHTLLKVLEMVPDSNISNNDQQRIREMMEQVFRPLSGGSGSGATSERTREAIRKLELLLQSEPLTRVQPEEEVYL